MHPFDREKYETSSKTKLTYFLIAFIVIGTIISYVRGDRDTYTEIGESELYDFEGVLAKDILVFERGKSKGHHVYFELKEYPKHVFSLRGIQLSSVVNRKEMKKLETGDTCYFSIDTSDRKYLTNNIEDGRYIALYQVKTRETSYLDLETLNKARASNLTFTSKALIFFFSAVALYLLLDYFGFIDKVQRWMQLQRDKFR